LFSFYSRACGRGEKIQQHQQKDIMNNKNENLEKEEKGGKKARAAGAQRLLLLLEFRIQVKEEERGKSDLLTNL